MKIRKVEKRDFLEIKLLFKRNNLSFYKPKVWNVLWKSFYIIKREKKVLGWVVEHNKKIVGHIGTFTTEYYYLNKKINCSVLNGWVVDKKFRNISLVLIKKYFDQKNCDFFYGTTFVEETTSIVKKFGAKQVPVPSLKKSYYILTNSKNFLKFIFKKDFFFKQFVINFLNILINFFLSYKIKYWKKIKIEKQIIITKELNSNMNNFLKIYLKNSKSLIFNMNNFFFKNILSSLIKRNLIWFFHVYEKNIVVGYSCCLIVKKGKFRSALLLDVKALSQTSYKSLIKANINESEKRNCMYFNFRNFSSEKTEVVKNFKPFTRNLSYSNFYYKLNNYKLKKLITNQNIWDTSNLDGDIILNY
tara:strand:+ start:322 stop:1398 length:1077 start_codon:yes stop_codon:yes gene_type:complete